MNDKTKKEGSQNDKTKKEGSQKAISFEKANDALNEIMLTGESSTGISEQQALEILEKMPTESFEEMTGEYFDFSKKGEFNFVFEGMGTSEFSKNGITKTVDVVKLKDKNGQRFIAGGAILVNTCKQLTQTPCFIRVITTGEKIESKSGGEYYEMRVLVPPGAKK